MKTRFWKRACLTLPLAMLAAHVTNPRTTFAQAPQTVTESAVFSDDAGDIFGTTLPGAQPVSTAGPCTDSVAPNCLPAQPGAEVPGYSPPATSSPEAVFSNPAPLGALPSGQGALTAQNLVAAANMPGGYLDPAAPATMFRLRYDVASDGAYADRGEYFYAKCGCFRQIGADPAADGPEGLISSVDYQAVNAYLEYAFNERFSIFGDLPVRFVDYSLVSNALPALTSTGGLADANVGFKYAIIADPDEYFTFQLRTYLPTGDAAKGLGTSNVAIEPSLLYYRRLSQRWLFQSQFTEFTPIQGSDFASDVLQYGAGLGYLALQTDNVTVMPTLEIVGWTFLGGQKFNALYAGTAQSANGDTIVNIKPGVRIGLGESNQYLSMPNHSIYAGFGIPITNEKFYNDLFRLEYRILF